MTSRQTFSAWSVLTVALWIGFARPAAAKYIGGQAPKPGCSCACACTVPSVGERSNTSSNVSRTQGNILENVPISTVTSGFGPTINLTLTYNSQNADNSLDTRDTVAGYGWTHSYNIFLFGQLGAMFRYDGAGRVTKYSLGPGGTFVTANGYFETLKKTGSTTFTITTKNQTVYTFTFIPGTPFLVGGPVYRLTQIQDRNGNQTTFTYTSGNLTKIADTYSRAITFTYNPANKIATISDPLGRVTKFQYDSTNHLLTQITDPNGKTIQYTYNSLYQITSKADKAGRTFTYSYNSGFEPTAIYDSGHTTPATLSNPNNWGTDSNQLAQNQLQVYLPSTATTADGLGRAWQYTYDANGYVKQEKDPDGATTIYSYDPGTLQLASVQDANLNTTSYVYDTQGNRTQMKDALGNVTKYTYDPTYNMMTSVTDARGRVTTYTIDPGTGNKTAEQDPAGGVETWSYDVHGNVTQHVDKDGNVTKYSYDGAGNLIQQTDAFGTAIQATTQYAYDAVGNRTSMTDALGRVTQYQYDGMNRLIQETDAVGTPQQRTIQMQYDGEGNRTQVVDGRGIVTQYQYDVRQRLTTMTEAVGTPEQRTTTTTYDANDNRLTITNPRGFITTYQYDTRNRMIKETDATGTSVQAITQTTYDAVSNVTSQTDANTHTTTYTYDTLNRRKSMTDALAGKALYFYDGGTFTGSVILGSVTANCTQCGATPGSNLITEQVDSDGTASLHAGTTYYKYDALNRVELVVRRTGCIGGPTGTGCSDTINTTSDAVTITTYDAQGNNLNVTEPDANPTQYQYDARNRRTQETNAAGDITTTTYDAVNNVATVTAPNGNTKSNMYDALDRVVQVTDSIGLVGTASYDADGNAITQGDGDGNVTNYAYDHLNRRTSTQDPLGQATTYTYDAVGNLLSITDRDSHTIKYSYDALNRRSTMTDALNNVTQWQYDSAGNMTQITDANLHATQYSYDFINRPHCETYADLTMRCYTYDPVGNLTQRQDPTPGQSVTYTYSDLYFLLQRSYAPSGAADTMTYDLSGRTLTGTRVNGSFNWPVTFTYDGADRVTQSVQSGKAVSYSYDIPGKKRVITYPGGRVVTEHTDARARMDHINDSPSIVQYSYDLANNMLARNFNNSTTSSYTYNGNNWITSLQHSNGSPFATFNYVYDHEGNKQYEQKVHDPMHSECYGYDAENRLTSYGSGTLGSPNPCPVVAPPTPPSQSSYSLDPVGNWNSLTTNAGTQTRVHNPMNELTKIGPTTTLTYDPDGDLANDGTYSYVHDEEHRLISVTQMSGSILAGQYQYDAFSRRVQKIANPTGSSSTTTLYYYDGPRSVEEQIGGVTQATYVYGNYVDEVITMDRGGQTYYYHPNALWSVEAVTNSAGSPIERYTYDAYGAVTSTGGSNSWGTPHSAIGNPWMFTGRQFDEETSLYYYRVRYYDGAKGRFLERDPLEYASGMNLYEYVRDNPVNRVDPSGRQNADPLARAKELIPDLDSNRYVTRRRATEELTCLCRGDNSGKVQEALQEVLDSRPALEVRRRVESILEQCRRFRACLPVVFAATQDPLLSQGQRRAIFDAVARNNVYTNGLGGVTSLVAQQYISQLRLFANLANVLSNVGLLSDPFGALQRVVRQLRALKDCPDTKSALEEELRRVENEITGGNPFALPGNLRDLLLYSGLSMALQ